MTKEEKHERRLVKRKLREAVEKHHFTVYKFYARPAQLLAGRNPAQVKRLD